MRLDCKRYSVQIHRHNIPARDLKINALVAVNVRAWP